MKNIVTIALVVSKVSLECLIGAGLAVILTLKYPAEAAHTVSGWCASVGVFIGAL